MNYCKTCNEPFGVVGLTHCDDCFICQECNKRYHFSVGDAPPLGLCGFCLTDPYDYIDNVMYEKESSNPDP